MLAASGEVKVADFGLARLYSQDSESNLTQIGVTMGTPLYMSPEQVEGKPLDPRSDIYSLGVTGYQMLRGEPPFSGETALGIAVQHLKSQPPRLEIARPDLPASVCRIVHKMLAKDPAERYATPRDLLRELRAVSTELFPDEPAEESAERADAEVADALEARRQATERLAAAMKTTAMPVFAPSMAWRWVAAALLCFLLGTALAFAVRTRPIVSPVDDDEVIPPYETAAEQYFYAVMLNTEAAWKSVPKYFPNDKTYALPAKQQLAMLYLRRLDLDAAMALFDEFARMSNVEEQYRAFGLAGQAVVLNRRFEYRDSAAKLTELLPLRNQLRGEMRLLIAPTFQSNRKALGESQPSQRWDEWFQKSTPPAEATSPRAAEPAAGRSEEK
jgi:serine/threonine-protein kinase